MVSQLGLFSPKTTTPTSLRDGLRWYQNAAVDNVLEQLQSIRSTLIVAATGTGKTQILCAVASEWSHGRVLILAHRTELIQQASSRLERMAGIHIGSDIGIEQAELRSNKHQHFVIGSVPTVHRRLDRLDAEGGFGLIIVDEAHHAPAKSYKKILDYFGGAKVLGVTATPDRKDEKAMGRVFDDTALVYDIGEAIEDGFLVPVEGEEVFLHEVNLDNVGTSSGDLIAGQLDDEMAKAADGGVEELVKRVPPGTRQGIVFCAGVKSAHYMADRLNKVRPGLAASVDGKTDPQERRRIVDDFRNGEIQWLVNCMVATEGFDAPGASVIAMFRPTASRALYAQKIGRGTRPHPGVIDGMLDREQSKARRAAIAASTKPNMTILDFVGNNTKHSLVTPADVLGGKFTDAERKQAARHQKEKGGDVLTNLRNAREELRKAAEARVRARTVASSKPFDPFGVVGYTMEHDRQYVQRFGRTPMTYKQRLALEEEGFPRKELLNMSAHGAAQLFKRVKKRKKKGLANQRQLMVLHRFGVSEPNAKYRDAARAMLYISSCGGKRDMVDSQELARITRGEK